MDSNTLFPSRGPYSGASTPRFDFLNSQYDDTFGTPRPDSLFSDKTDYFSIGKLQTSSSGLTPYGMSNNLFGGSPYPNPMDITPPQTATDPPPNWPYGERLDDQSEELSLSIPQLSTDTAKIQFGQTTPPDEEERAPDMKDLTSTYNSKPSAVKRESTSSVKSTKPAKRSKKNKNQTLEESNEDNEKRSKFLERNRVAASKCRQKKKEHNGQLESRAKDLERTNASLKVLMQDLLNEKTSLMMQMAMHNPGECECHQIHQHLASFKALYQSPVSRPQTADSTKDGGLLSSATSPAGSE